MNFQVLGVRLGEECGSPEASSERHKAMDAPISESRSRSWLTLKIVPERGSRVRISPEKQLRDLEGFLHVHSEPPSYVRDSRGVGVVQHFDGLKGEFGTIEERYIITVWVRTEQLKTMTEALIHGRYPDYVSLDVRGTEVIDLGDAEEWNPAKCPNLIVLSVSFGLALSPSIPKENSEEQTLNQHAPLSLAGLTGVSRELQANAASVGRLESLLRWILALLVVLIVARFWK